jgi:group II intron reverse transcriptase/maturase
MLTKTFKELFTKQNLLQALDNYKKNNEYQEVKNSIESGEFLKTLKKGYIPQPLKSFKIPKNNNEYRELTQASLHSKVIQKILANALNDSVKFSDKSYAFRKGKGTLKAINRTKDFLRKYNFVAKADIDNFFDTINQQKLIKILNKTIQDKKILYLISIFLKNGMLKRHKWIDKQKGVYQGDVLSPVLSNIYLNIFDTKLENKNIDFIRYADDMIFFANSKKEAKQHLQTATKILNKLSLQFGEDKSYIASIEDGFEFLGLRFQNHTITMDNNRLTKKLSTIIQKTKK